MHVIGAGVTGSVDAEASDKLRMLQLHYLYGKSDHSGVNRGDSAVPVGIDCHVSGVTVLVLAVAGGAAHASVVLWRAESGMDIDVDICDRLVAMPASYLLNHQLQLVEQLRIYRGIAWPDTNLV